MKKSLKKQYFFDKNNDKRNLNHLRVEENSIKIYNVSCKKELTICYVRYKKGEK